MIKTYTVDVTKTVTYRTTVQAIDEVQAKIFASSKVHDANPNEYNYQWDVVKDHQETKVVEEE